MPTITALAAFDDESGDRSNNKNSRVRSVRRETRRDSQSRVSMASRRGRERRLSVRGELRDRPDVSKIARAVIQLALAQAEAEAKAHQRTDEANHNAKGGSDA